MFISFRLAGCLRMLVLLVCLAVVPGIVLGQDVPREEAEEREMRQRSERLEREEGESQRPLDLGEQEGQYLEKAELRRMNHRWEEERARDHREEQTRQASQEREHRQRMLEAQRLDFEIHKLHRERVATQAHIANDAVLAAAFALERLPEIVPHEQERREVLNDLLDATQNVAVRRLIRMKLLEIPTDRREESLEVIRGLLD